MSAKDFIREISQILLQQRKRSAFTLFGVFWGIMMLSLMLSVGMGMEGGIIRQLVEVESNCVALSASPTTEAAYGLESGRRWHMDDRDIAALESAYPGVIRRTVTLGHFPHAGELVPVTSDYGFLQASVVGISDGYSDVHPQKIIFGRALDALDCEGLRKTCVLGESTAGTLFATAEDAVGKELKIGDSSFLVVGVVRRSNPIMLFGVEIADDVFIPITTAGIIFNRQGEYDTVACILEDGCRSEDYAGKFGALTGRRNKIADSDVSALTVLDLDKYFGMFVSLLKALRVLIWVVGSGTLLTGLVGISNIMMISVFERTREIGVRLSFGAVPSSITLQIMCESLVLALVGGLAGLVAGGWAVYAVASAVTTTDSSVFANIHVPFLPMMAALAILVIGGLAAGYYPARRAMSIDVIDALRDE